MRLGNFFVGVDCTPDGADGEPHRYEYSPGNISVYVKFRQALAHDLDFFIYAVFDQTLSITESRAVTTISAI